MKRDFPVKYGSNSLGDISSLKGDLHSAFGALLQIPILHGAMFEITLSADPTETAHGFGRNYNGYIVVKRETWDADKNILMPGIPYTGDIYEAESENSEQFISLYSPGITVDSVSYNVVANVWVF